MILIFNNSLKYLLDLLYLMMSPGDLFLNLSSEMFPQWNNSGYMALYLQLFQKSSEF